MTTPDNPMGLASMSYDQYSNLSPEAFEAFMNQGKEGNLLDMLNPYGRHSQTQTIPVGNY